MRYMRSSDTVSRTMSFGFGNDRDRNVRKHILSSPGAILQVIRFNAQCGVVILNGRASSLLGYEDKSGALANSADLLRTILSMQGKRILIAGQSVAMNLDSRVQALFPGGISLDSHSICEDGICLINGNLAEGMLDAMIVAYARGLYPVLLLDGLTEITPGLIDKLNQEQKYLLLTSQNVSLPKKLNSLRFAFINSFPGNAKSFSERLWTKYVDVTSSLIGLVNEKGKGASAITSHVQREERPIVSAEDLEDWSKKKLLVFDFLKNSAYAFRKPVIELWRINTL